MRLKRQVDEWRQRMNRNIILKRKVNVQGWRVIGQIAKSRKRKEFEFVLRRAQENYGTNALDIARHLLCEPSREVVAKRLLKIGESLGLLKEIRERSGKYVLTKQGENAIATGEVFVPERGAWTLWTSQDPLLPSPILRVDVFKDEKAYRAVRSRNKSRSFDDLPRFLRDVQGKEITPPTSSDGDGIPIRIDELEEKVEKVKDSIADLSLRWNVGDRQLRLNGIWEGKKVDTELQPPDVSFDEIWLELLFRERLIPQWSRQQQALRLGYDEINDDERETMRRDLNFQNPFLFDYWEFEPFTVEQIPITAYSREDAYKWAVWRLNSRIRDFATSKLYSEWWKEASEPFKEFHLACPTRSVLALKAWKGAAERPDTRIWHLIAVEDWDLK